MQVGVSQMTHADPVRKDFLSPSRASSLSDAPLRMLHVSRSPSSAPPPPCHTHLLVHRGCRASGSCWPLPACPSLLPAGDVDVLLGKLSRLCLHGRSYEIERSFIEARRRGISRSYEMLSYAYFHNAIAEIGEGGGRIGVWSVHFSVSFLCRVKMLCVLHARSYPWRCLR